MKNITANAILNLKEQPPRLYVHGSILTPNVDDEIEIKQAYPTGINPAILVLDLVVIRELGPMKLTPKPFIFELNNEAAKGYSQVTIRYGLNESITENVQIFG